MGITVAGISRRFVRLAECDLAVGFPIASHQSAIENLRRPVARRSLRPINVIVHHRAGATSTAAGGVVVASRDEPRYREVRMAKKKEEAAPAETPTPDPAARIRNSKRPSAQAKPQLPRPCRRPRRSPRQAAEAATAEAPADGKKKPGVPPRRGKKLRNHLKNVEKKLREAGPVPVKQAVAELKKLKRAKFDETVEIHINLGIDADAVRPDGPRRDPAAARHRQDASASRCSARATTSPRPRPPGPTSPAAADLVEKIQKENFLDFDVALATQDMMGQVSRLGKVLGPRGLMPTPKAGTVVPATGDVAAAVKEFKAGKVEYRSDKTGQIHAGVGKMSFDDEKLVENINVVRRAGPRAPSRRA